MIQLVTGYMDRLFAPSRTAWLLLPLLSSLLLDACSFYSARRLVTVRLPEFPVRWLQLPEPRAFHLFYRLDGVTVSVDLPPGTVTRELPLNKGTFVPILAYPVSGSPETRLLPAGAVFPCDLNSNGELLLNWSNGAAAQVLTTLLECEIDIDAINVPRLLSELPARTGGDPWTADLSGMVRHFAEGAFRADWIRQAPLFEVVLQLPSTLGAFPGISLLTENALEPELLLGGPAANETEEQSTVSLGKLCQGMHRFIVERRNDSDSSVRLDVDVQPDGRAEWFAAPLE